MTLISPPSRIDAESFLLFSSSLTQINPLLHSKIDPLIHEKIEASPPAPFPIDADPPTILHVHADPIVPLLVIALWVLSAI